MSDQGGIDLNFGGDEANPIKPATFEPVPPGTYSAVIDDVDVKNTNPKDGVAQVASDGTPARYLNVKYKINQGDYEGRFVWGIQSIRFPKDPLDDTKDERQVREIFLGWLNTVTGTDFAGTNQQFNPKLLMGAEVSLVVSVDSSYDGKPRNKVMRVEEKGAEGSSLDSLRRTL